MSAVKSGQLLRLAMRTSRRNGVVICAPRTSVVAARSMATESKSLKREISEKVPATIFDAENASNAPQHVSLPVGAKSAPAAVESVASVTPLTQAIFDKLPASLQKMTVMHKVVIITGGARGLGNNMARACIEAGAKAICIFDANKELGDEAAEELYKASGVSVRFYKVDVRDKAHIDEALEHVVKDFGAPDVLINSAGIADSNIPAEKYDPAMFRRLIDINLNGTFLMCQAVGKAMMAAGKPGSMVLVASMSGSIVNYPQEQCCYNASKAGVIQLSKSLAAEWAKYNIRVNSISPGYMDTALNNVPALDAQKKIWKSLTPQARLGAVDDLNGLAVLLASDASAYMTGADVIIDGGYTLY